MLCEICQRAEATVHITQVFQGTAPDGTQENHYCEKCAKEKNESRGFSMVDLLLGQFADHLFVVKDDMIYTPLASGGISGGITREMMAEAARALGREVLPRELTRADLFGGDELFFTASSLGSGVDVMPLCELEGRPVGTGAIGPVTGIFFRYFQEHPPK